MSDKVTYEFAIIRILPKVEREEFMNIGVLLFSKRKKYLGIKYHLDKNRLTAFSKNIDIDWVETYLKAWELVCAGGKAGGSIGGLELSSRFRWLAASKSTIIQCSKTHSGLCNAPQETLEDIFERYVL